MKPKKNRLPAPSHSDATPAPAEIIDVRSRRAVLTGPATAPAKLPEQGNFRVPTGASAADGMTIIEVPHRPRLWLRVAFIFASGANPTQTALTTAEFVSRMCAADKRLRLTVDPVKSATNGNELALAFALGRWGTLETMWVEEFKPVVSALAAATKGIELKSVEVIAGE